LISVTEEAKKHIAEFHTILREETIRLIDLVGPATTQKWCEVICEIEKACTQDAG